MALKFYTSVEKGLRIKFRKFLELIPTFVEVKGEKTDRGDLSGPPSWLGLKVLSSMNFSNESASEIKWIGCGSFTSSIFSRSYSLFRS